MRASASVNLDTFCVTRRLTNRERDNFGFTGGFVGRTDKRVRLFRAMRGSAAVDIVSKYEAAALAFKYPILDRHPLGLEDQLKKSGPVEWGPRLRLQLGKVAVYQLGWGNKAIGAEILSDVDLLQQERLDVATRLSEFVGSEVRLPEVDGFFLSMAEFQGNDWGVERAVAFAQHKRLETVSVYEATLRTDNIEAAAATSMLHQFAMRSRQQRT